MYLLIQNRGIAPTDGFVLLGASTTRDDNTEGTIGMFGSGTKHSINLLLRKQLHFRICCGKTRLDFETEPHNMDDGLTEKTVDKVVCQFSGNSRRRIECGWVVDFGALDWDDLGMALREFISNAIDRTLRQGDDVKEAIASGDLCVKPVDTATARDGYTRIFIKLDEGGEILRYLAELPKRFLHWGNDLNKRLLPKAARGLDGDGAMIYREGVFVRQLADKSLFDYDFRAGDLSIDDCRKSSDYTVRAACTKYLAASNSGDLARVFQSIADSEKTLESGVDNYYLCNPYTDDITDEQKETFQQAWSTLGDNAVAADKESKHAIEYANRKGHKVVTLPANWAGVIGKFGIPTTNDVLDENEQSGREITAPTDAALQSLDRIWELCELVELTNGKDKPGVNCYRELSSDAECSVFGFYQPGTKIVNTREDISTGPNKKLNKTMLEEVAHYITGATDNSRDFQNFFMDTIVELAL